MTEVVDALEGTPLQPAKTSTQAGSAGSDIAAQAIKEQRRAGWMAV
jgi:hypothetical protein